MVQRRSLRYLERLVQAQMPQKQVPQFMRQRGELHGGGVITIDVHSVVGGLFFVGGTLDDPD